MASSEDSYLFNPCVEHVVTVTSRLKIFMSSTLPIQDYTNWQNDVLVKFDQR